MLYPQAIDELDKGNIVWRKDTINPFNHIIRTWHVIKENQLPDFSVVCSFHELIKHDKPANMYLDLEADDKLISLEDFEKQTQEIINVLDPNRPFRISNAHRPGKLSSRVIFPGWVFEHARDIGFYVKEKTEGLFSIIDYSVYSSRSVKSLRIAGTYKATEEGKYIAKFLVPEGVPLSELLVRPHGIRSATIIVPATLHQETTSDQRNQLLGTDNIISQKVSLIYKWIELNCPHYTMCISSRPDSKGNCSFQLKGYFCKYKQTNHASNSMYINLYFGTGNTLMMKCVCSDSDCGGIPYDFPDLQLIRSLFQFN